MKLSDMSNEKLFSLALEKSGYDSEPTALNIKECFSDYVDCGYWSNISSDDIEDFSAREMAVSLIKPNGW